MPSKKDDLIVSILNKIDNKMDNLENKFAALDKDIVVQQAHAEVHQELLRSTQEHMEIMSKTLEINTESLKEHIRRTNLLENSIGGLDTRLTPLERHYQRLIAISWFIAKIGAVLSSIGGIAYYVIRIINKQ